MEDRLRALDEALERREAARAFLAACRVDGQKLEEIEQAADAVRQTEAQMQAATAQVEVTGPDGAAVVVDGAEQRLGGEPLRLDAAEERRIELPGGFAVVVRPSRSQALLEGRLAERRRRLEELLGEAGAASVEAARELEQRRRDAERDIAEADRAAKQALRDLPDREDLAGRIARTRERVEGYRSAHAGRRLPATLEEARRLKAASDDERGRAQQQAEAAAAAAAGGGGGGRGGGAGAGRPGGAARRGEETARRSASAASDCGAGAAAGGAGCRRCGGARGSGAGRAAGSGGPAAGGGAGRGRAGGGGGRP
ncbi:MAG: hypothetical protein KatS3mg062_0892 [Tepidiforma sp.]|nr:MAG: hypothetical protein KatS3mg062_0892 [Tepidiforma sp.]